MKNPNSFPCRLAAALIFFMQIQWNVDAAKKDGGFIVYPAGQTGAVVFSHLIHGKNNAGYACDKCHAESAEKTQLFKMDDIRQGKACGSCHNGKTAGQRRKQAAPPVEECGACHIPASDIVFKLNRMDPVKFSHLRHLSVDPAKKVSRPTGFSCGNCHPAPFDRASKGAIGMEVPHETGGCAECHNGRKRNERTVFAATTRCLTCHRSLTGEP